MSRSGARCTGSNSSAPAASAEPGSTTSYALLWGELDQDRVPLPGQRQPPPGVGLAERPLDLARVARAAEIEHERALHLALASAWAAKPQQLRRLGGPGPQHALDEAQAPAGHADRVPAGPEDDRDLVGLAVPARGSHAQTRARGQITHRTA